MKPGFIDQLIEACGWVVGKTLLFFLAIALGAGIALTAMYFSGTIPGGVGDESGSSLIALGFIGPILAQFAVVFIAALWWVRSEKVGALSWTIIAALAAVEIPAMYASRQSPFRLAFLWIMIAASIYGLFRALQVFRVTQAQRFAANAETLESENEARRAVLTARFGTVSSSARDLGIVE